MLQPSATLSWVVGTVSLDLVLLLIFHSGVQTLPGSAPRRRLLHPQSGSGCPNRNVGYQIRVLCAHIFLLKLGQRIGYGE